MSQKHHQQSYQPLPTAAMENEAMSGSSNNSSNDDQDNRGITATHSSQRLVGAGNAPTIASRYGIYSVAVLCFVNLINYMDRFTIAGVLTDLQVDFNIGNSSAGLLQTVFIFTYMIFAPIFGYLGDRYSRPWIMAVGVALWSTTTLLGSFMPNYFWFMSFRALVGIGEASYSTIAPTIISDMFVGDMRSKMLALFYFAIPVGSGFGYIVGSKTAALANNWRWALRVTPVLGIAAVFLILGVKDPERGASEGAQNHETTTYKEDLTNLLKNRSFMLSTAGFTCVAFVTGALAWWGPTFIHLGMRMQPGNENILLDDVAFNFGLITMVAGLLGVPLGSFLSQYLIKKYPTADPVICAFGLIISAPLLTGACLIVSKSSIATYFLIFFGQLALNLNWAVVADILLYVVVPTRRSTAEAFQILISHALGDAGSPYLVGLISESIMRHMTSPTLNYISTDLEVRSLTLANLTEATTVAALDPISDVVRFEALQYSLFSTTFIEVLGGIFFLFTACFIVRDKANANASASNEAITESTSA